MFKHDKIIFLWKENELSFYDKLLKKYKDFIRKSSEKRGCIQTLLNRGDRMFSSVSLVEQDEKRTRKRKQENRTKDERENGQRLPRIHEVVAS